MDNQGEEKNSTEKSIKKKFDFYPEIFLSILKNLGLNIFFVPIIILAATFYNSMVIFMQSSRRTEVNQLPAALAVVLILNLLSAAFFSRNYKKQAGPLFLILATGGLFGYLISLWIINI